MAIASSEYFVVKLKSADLPAKLTAEPAGSTGHFVLRDSSPSTTRVRAEDGYLGECEDLFQLRRKLRLSFQSSRRRSNVYSEESISACR